MTEHAGPIQAMTDRTVPIDDDRECYEPICCPRCGNRGQEESRFTVDTYVWINGNGEPIFVGGYTDNPYLRILCQRCDYEAPADEFTLQGGPGDQESHPGPRLSM